MLDRCRDVLARAARWCPDATAAQLDAALVRLAFEQADAAGLAESLELEKPEGWPFGTERDLLEACERILETEELGLPDIFRRSCEPHPSGRAMGPGNQTCGTCAWLSRGRCLQGGDQGNAPKAARPWPACARWEPILSDASCGSCGACCRQGYSLAPVRRGEPILLAHPQWIAKQGRTAHLPRPDGLCVALKGDGSADMPWRCRAYEVRPHACADLAPGSHACLVARRRTGLSR